MDDIEQLILETLSFFEPMSKEMIILDFDTAQLQNLQHFDTETLEKKLDELVAKKLVKKTIKDREIYFQRVMPKRPWWKKIFRL